MDAMEDDGTLAWGRRGPEPVYDTTLRVLCVGSKELARSIKAGNRWQTVYEAREPYSQTKRLRPHCVMPQSSEGHFLETITWPQNDEASRVQSQPLTVHVWLNTLLSADLAIAKRTASIHFVTFTQHPVPLTASWKLGSPNRVTVPVVDKMSQTQLVHILFSHKLLNTFSCVCVFSLLTVTCIITVI
jgi:hypothetical protein